MYISVEFIFAGGSITYCDRYDIDLVENVIQIVSAVRSDGDIGCVECHVTVFVQGILISFVYDAFISPVATIVYRCRPAYIVVNAECVTAESIVRTEHIDAAVKYIRLAVRNVFP